MSGQPSDVGGGVGWVVGCPRPCSRQLRFPQVTHRSSSGRSRSCLVVPGLPRLGYEAVKPRVVAGTAPRMTHMKLNPHAAPLLAAQSCHPAWPPLGATQCCHPPLPFSLATLRRHPVFATHFITFPTHLCHQHRPTRPPPLTTPTPAHTTPALQPKPNL